MGQTEFDASLSATFEHKSIWTDSGNIGAIAVNPIELGDSAPKMAVNVDHAIYIYMVWHSEIWSLR